ESAAAARHRTSDNLSFRMSAFKVGLILALPFVDVKQASGKLTGMLRRVAGFLFFIISVGFLSAATKPNIILITIDSARSDRMGFLGAKQGLTPNLDVL